MRRDTVLLCLGLPLLCLAIYWNALDNPFHYDDIHSIVDNPSVRSLENVSLFFKDIRTFSADVDRGMFRPLLLVSYALNHALGDYDVQGYRLLNILLHAINACLVAWLTRLLFPGQRSAALIAGLLFVVHPLATEPVNYISSRSESLAATFYLLTVSLFARARQGDSSRLTYAAWVAFEFGLLTKMTVVTAPVVLLLYEFLFPTTGSRTERGFRLRPGIVRRQLPFWIILLIHFGVVTLNTYLPRSLGHPVRAGSAQLLTQLKAVGYYLYLAVFPAHLNVEHQFAVQQQVSGLVLVSLALVLSGGWLLWRTYHRPGRNSVTLFGLGWAAIAMVPVMAMPLNVLVNERRLYLPTAALCLLLGVLISRHLAVAGKPRLGARSLVIAAVIVLSAASVMRNRVWADDFSLWRDVIEKAPLMPRGHLYLGNAHKDAAQQTSGAAAHRHWSEAAAAYQRVIDLGGDRALSLRALNNRGSILLTFGKLQEAEAIFRHALDINADYVDAAVNLGVVYLRQSRQRSGGERMLALRRSIVSLEHAVAGSPNHWQAFGNLGVAYQDLGDADSARQAYEKALELKADDHLALKNLGVLYYQMAGESDKQSPAEARQHLLLAQSYLYRALQASPRYQAAREALTKVEESLRSLDGPQTIGQTSGATKAPVSR